MLTIEAKRVIEFSDVVAELEPSLDLLEAELLDIETTMAITSTCLCTIKCGLKLLDNTL